MFRRIKRLLTDDRGQIQQVMYVALAALLVVVLYRYGKEMLTTIADTLREMGLIK